LHPRPNVSRVSAARAPSARRRHNAAVSLRRRWRRRRRRKRRVLDDNITIFYRDRDVRRERISSAKKKSKLYIFQISIL